MKNTDDAVLMEVCLPLQGGITSSLRRRSMKRTDVAIMVQAAIDKKR